MIGVSMTNKRAATSLAPAPEPSHASAPSGIVYVVDDDAAIRDSLRFLLAAMGLSVKTFESAAEFLAESLPEGPACLLLDVRMPEMNGLELQQALTDRGCDVPIVFLTGHGDVQTAVTALQHGAVDFLEKPFDEHDIVERVRRALAISAGRTVHGARAVRTQELLATLTPRERQVLELIVEGKTTKAVAAELGTSFNTVQNQRSAILRKMQVHSVADLVRIVVEAGGRRPPAA